ncbi:MAG: iron ABC transporter permease [Thermoproteota archaeon]
MEARSLLKGFARLARVARAARIEYELLILFYIPLAFFLFSFVAPLTVLLGEVPRLDPRQLASSYYIDLNGDGLEKFVEVITSETSVRVRVNGFDFGVIPNSLLNAILVTLASSVLGTAVAIAVGLYRFRGQQVLRALAYAPLLVAPFVNAYVIYRYIGTSFAGNTFSLVLSRVLSPILDRNVILEFAGQAGVALAQTMLFYPIVYVNVLSALNALDATLIEQALNLGARGLQLLRKVVIPLVMPGVLAGSTLVFILSLEDVGAPIIFSFDKMMSYQIYAYFQGVASEASRPVIAALSLIMLAFAVTPLVFVRRYLSLRYYARLARGAPRPFAGMKASRRALVVIYLVLFPIAAVAASPQFGVAVLAFSRKWVGPLPQPLNADELLLNFKTLFEMEGVVRSITNSISYLARAIIIIAIVGFMAGYSLGRARLPGATLLDVLSSAPLAVPGLVVAFSYYVFFSSSLFRESLLDPVVNPATILVLAYAVRKIPFTIRSIFTGVIQTPQELEEAAQSLGARRFRVLAKVTIPLVWRSILAGLLLSSIYVLSEVSVSITIGGLKGSIISTDHAAPITLAILTLTTQGTVVAGGTQPQAKAAALAAILMSLEALVIFMASRLARRGQAIVTL